MRTLIAACSHQRWPPRGVAQYARSTNRRTMVTGISCRMTSQSQESCSWAWAA